MVFNRDMTATHILPAFGLPYAPADIDDHGRATATCPVCGFVAVAEGSMGYDNHEDNATKGAGMVYALHFEREANAAR